MQLHDYRWYTLEVLGRVIVVLILVSPIVIVTGRVVDLCSRRPFHVLSVWFSVAVVGRRLIDLVCRCQVRVCLLCHQVVFEVLVVMVNVVVLVVAQVFSAMSVGMMADN